MQLNEVEFRDDIKRDAAGFGNKKYLGIHIDQATKTFNRKAPGYQTQKSQHTPLQFHSKISRRMKDGSTVHKHVYHGHDRDGYKTYMTTDHEGKVDSVLALDRSERSKSHEVQTAVASPGAGMHRLYHHLITKHDHMITGSEQSPGGRSIWQRLSKMHGVHVHGYDPQTKRAVHVDLHGDRRETHVSADDLHLARHDRDMSTGPRGRSTKDSQRAAADYRDLQATRRTILVAHKKESAAKTVLRVTGRKKPAAK